MAKIRVVEADKVAPFSPPGLEGIYESRLLVEKEGVGSEHLQVVHATLQPGQSPGGGGTHPAPYDEAYYILSGTGRMAFEHGDEEYIVGPNTAIYIPGDTWHEITNIGDDELVFLTLWPMTPKEKGVNGVFDARQEAWGTSFKLVDSE